MKKLLNNFRGAAVMLCLAMGSLAPATAQVGIGISVPGVSIGINMPLYPQFVRVPDYPVYYAPQLQTNFFFYDGLYWVYQQDSWYSSSWYDGPWYAVAPQGVPLFVLRIPVRYYRNPPPYFRDWRPDAPPRWGEHWGNDWSQRRSGWDRWDRRAVPAPAPLPTYQRQYTGDRYPRVEQQRELQTRNYRYQPRDAVVRQRYQEQAVRGAAAPSRQQAPQGSVAAQDRRPPPPQQPQPRAERREPQAPQANERPPGRADAPRPEQTQGPGKGKDKDKGQQPDRENGDEPGQQRKR